MRFMHTHAAVQNYIIFYYYSNLFSKFILRMLPLTAHTHAFI